MLAARQAQDPMPSAFRGLRVNGDWECGQHFGEARHARLIDSVSDVTHDRGIGDLKGPGPRHVSPGCKHLSEHRLCLCVLLVLEAPRYSNRGVKDTPLDSVPHRVYPDWPKRISNAAPLPPVPERLSRPTTCPSESG